MSDYAYLFTSTLLTLWVIMDPPGLLPVFIGLTNRLEPRDRNTAALRAAIVAASVIGLFAIFGRAILDYLHISVESLQVSGGLLLLIVAMQLLTGKLDEAPPEKPGSAVNVAIVPLGTPLLAGPGAIVATMLAVQSAQGIGGKLVVGAALVATMVSVWLFMRFAPEIKRLIKDEGVVLLTRIAGLLLAAIAVQMMADGILGFARSF
ncbi:MAG TPA: MarC family protein [Propionibacteriaceae bacterium]|nr:MarC family protein [Propionibacteriaceae bacterium]